MDSSQKTVDFWAKNFRDTEAGVRRVLNFWDHWQAVRIQRAIGVPQINDTSFQLPALQLLHSLTGGKDVDRAVSIGCGSGHKEIEFVRAGLVSHFTLVELVPELIEAAKSRFAAEGLQDKAAFVLGDYRSFVRNQRFDMVYFDNALHHMAEVENVLSDCIDMLPPGGVFLMDDFVGPTYNQFSDKIYDYADFIRGMLPPSFFEVGRVWPRLGRLTVQAYLQSDPSEACDSSSILPAIARLMPGAEIIPTGGLVYYLACREVFDRFGDSQHDETIIRLLFELDRVLTRANPELTCYALASWRKPEGPVEPASVDWKNAIRWPSNDIPI
jgi:SAM-dependent methyltransferase